jgi:hypothetical protein
MHIFRCLRSPAEFAAAFHRATITSVIAVITTVKWPETSRQRRTPDEPGGLYRVSGAYHCGVMYSRSLSKVRMSASGLRMLPPK